jgi:hypothetical protein
MAAAGFAVTITAKDAASATLKKISDSLAKFSKPVEGLRAEFEKLGKNAGLANLTKGLGAAGSAAEKLIEKLGGSTGSLGGAGSIGGMAMLARQYADVGQQATNMAYRIGIGTDQLAKFQSAARLGGASAGAMADAVATMAKNIGDVLSNRNPTMAGFFKQLEITPRYGADGRPDVATAFRGLREALAKAPTTQGKNAILDALGLPQEIRPVIENMDRLSAAADRIRSNAGAATEAGAKLNVEMQRLQENARGVGENVETVLAPGLTKITRGLADLTEKANEASKSGVGAHVATILSGGGQGALYGAGAGALLGAFRGLGGGVPGIVGGAVSGAVIGGLRGGAGGAIIAGAVDALGNAGGDRGAPAGQTQNLGVVGMGGTLPSNNPGNLRASPSSFQRFATPQAGLEAAARNLIAYRNRHHLDTIEGIASRWAPPSENNTAAYIRGVSEDVGALPGQTLPNDSTTNAALLAAIVKREQGGAKAAQFTPEQYAAAIEAAMARSGGREVTITVNAPPGTTAQVSQQGGGASRFWPVRMQYGLRAGAGANP